MSAGRSLEGADSDRPTEAALHSIQPGVQQRAVPRGRAGRSLRAEESRELAGQQEHLPRRCWPQARRPRRVVFRAEPLPL